jgi:hypothetical protein
MPPEDALHSRLPHQYSQDDGKDVERLPEASSDSAEVQRGFDHPH